jgi:hypothetical protein
MAKMTLEVSDAYDKRKAAIHEAGHLTVAMATGKRCRAELHTTGTANADQVKYWTGRAGEYGIHFTPIVAVAGIVAECMDETDDPWAIDEFIECGVVVPSESDLKLFPPEDQRLAVITQAIDLLNRHKTFFDWAVAELIEGEVITDGMAADNFPEPSSRRGDVTRASSPPCHREC